MTRSRRRRSAIPDEAERRRLAAEAVADAFLAVHWDATSLAGAGVRALDDESGWMPAVATETVEVFAGGPPPAREELVAHLFDSWSLARKFAEDEAEGRRPWRPPIPLTPSRMGPTRWNVPLLGTTGDLADWLGLHPAHLDWYADVRSLERSARDEPLRHYTYAWLPKRRGGHRLLEAPKPMLKLFQRRILHEILDEIPSHWGAHGFRRGRSVHTFAAPHVGQRAVVHLDLEGFFPSVRAGRVFGIFGAAGYPDEVAHRLTGLVTNAVPWPVLRRAGPVPASMRDAHRRATLDLSYPHLPQGAPTSPALANLAAYALDRRLWGLASRFDAVYTRYADDLVLSGGPALARAVPAVVRITSRIAAAEGFRINATKTRVARASERQLIAGLVVNERPNVDRRTYDRLKAVLHDARVNGAAAANREGHPAFRAHLLGRIGWVAASNPERGAKLRATFDQIEW